MLMKRVAEARTPLTVCPTSNVVIANRFRTLSEHPLLAMRDAGADLLVIGRRWDDGTLRDLERFAKEVLPAVA